MKYPLTLIGVIALIVLLLASAVLIEGGEQDQRFIIIVGVISTATTALLALLRTERNAEVQQANAVAVREAVVAQAVTVKADLNTASATLAGEAQRLEAKLDENTTVSKREAQRLEAKLDENTAVSKQAFNEANNFNKRLGEQARRFDSLLKAAAASNDVAIDTHEKVEDVHRVIVKRPADG